MPPPRAEAAQEPGRGIGNDPASWPLVQSMEKAQSESHVTRMRIGPNGLQQGKTRLLITDGTFQGKKMIFLWYVENHRTGRAWIEGFSMHGERLLAVGTDQVSTTR